jgi:hypothetical protein
LILMTSPSLLTVEEHDAERVMGGKIPDCGNLVAAPGGGPSGGHRARSCSSRLKLRDETGDDRGLAHAHDGRLAHELSQLVLRAMSLDDDPPAVGVVGNEGDRVEGRDVAPLDAIGPLDRGKRWPGCRG